MASFRASKVIGGSTPAVPSPSLFGDDGCTVSEEDDDDGVYNCKKWRRPLMIISKLVSTSFQSTKSPTSAASFNVGVMTATMISSNRKEVEYVSSQLFYRVELRHIIPDTACLKSDAETASLDSKGLNISRTSSMVPLSHFFS